MNSLAVFLVILGAFVPSALGDEQDCPGKGDGAVDWTKENQTWYYCQISLANRKSNYCYTTAIKTGEAENIAVFHFYDLGSKAEGTDSIAVKRIAEGKYIYPERGSTALNLKVTPDGKCLTYWKCYDAAGAWNGVPGSGAYFTFLCRKPELCKPQDKYEGDYKKIFDEAKNEKKVEIFDLNQGECKRLGIVPLQ